MFVLYYMGLSIAERRQIIRNQRINEIIEVLKSTRKQNRDLDIKKFINELCFRYNCSRRIAKEYYELAFYKLSRPYDEFKHVRGKK